MRAVGHAGDGRLTIRPPVAPVAWLRASGDRPPFPLGEAGCTLFHSAPCALWQGLAALGLGEGDAVLVPGLHRGPEVEVLLAAGLEIRFYAGTPMLEPDARELEMLLCPRVRALFLVHHLGFAQDAGRWRTWCDERELLLLEDATHAWGASLEHRPAGSSGALAVFSLRESWGLPDGGALLTDSSVPAPQALEQFELLGLARCQARWLAQRSHALARIATAVRPHQAPGADRPKPGAVAFGPARGTLRLLPRVADGHAAARRRAHYSLLLAELRDRVPAPFDRLPEQAAPHGFPIADDGHELLGRLRDLGIEARRPWRRPPPGVDADRLGALDDRCRCTLLLPVHQELRLGDVERIAAAVRATTARRPRARSSAAASAVADAGSELRCVLIETLDEPLPGWDGLALQAGSVFSSWEWVSTWWRHFAAGRSLRLVACYAADDRLVAILPLCLQRRAGMRIARFLGHGAADECGPICAPADRPAVARALRRMVDLIDADVLLLEQTLASSGWDALVGARVLRREGNPILSFRTASWNELLASWGPNLRKQVGGRLLRKLQREHGLVYRSTTAPAQLDDDMGTLLRLHEARWEGRTAAFTGRAAFHREFAAIALRRGWLRLLLLELDGQPAAALYNLRFGGAEAYYQAGRDPEWSRRPLGLLLIAESIRLAQEAGLREFRFGRGEEDFKYRLANADPGLQTIVLAGTRPGAAAVAGVVAVPTSVVKRARRWIRS